MLGGAALVVGAATAGARAEAFAFLSPVTQACASCPGGLALDVQRSLLGETRWDARAGGALADGIQVTIRPGIAAAIGISDPTLAARIDAAVVAGVAAWSSPVLDFDITFGTGASEITIGVGASQFLGGHTEITRTFSAGRSLTEGTVVPGLAFSNARITLNQGSLTSMFVSVNFELALGGLQRLVSHELGHALGLGHPTDVWEYNVVVDATGALVTDADAVDDTAIMVPFGSLPGLLVGFDPALRPDDLVGRDVLYPHLAPEPRGLALGAAGIAGAALGRRRAGRRP